jgi:UDPglucose 6-dehydrogenase
MKIAIIGTGYVGLVSGACFSEIGTHVTCIDIDAVKIENLKKGIIPIYEPGLEEIVTRNYKAERLHFGTEIKEVLNDVQIVFCAVGTPPQEDGSADLQYVYQVAETIGKHITGYVLVVNKSTVPVGTGKKVREIIQAELDKRGIEVDFDVASNPEFLKEGAAIKDFMSPDRVVIGVESERAKEVMTKLYRPFLLNNFRVIFMDIPSAEMTKYAANAMLATRISFMNDMANLCELVGADVNMVRKGIGSDARIGNKFLYPGCGYGGSCFPKDVKALVNTAKEYGYPMRILQAVEEVNDQQKHILFEKLNKYVKNQWNGKTVAIWGLTFKPNTDDMREAPSLVLIQQLLDAGCMVKVFDPLVKQLHLEHPLLNYANDIYDAVNDAHAVVLVTEWQEFRLPAWQVIYKAMKQPLVIDGRNIYDKTEMNQYGFVYEGIGISSK